MNNKTIKIGLIVGLIFLFINKISIVSIFNGIFSI